MVHKSIKLIRGFFIRNVSSEDNTSFLMPLLILE